MLELRCPDLDAALATFEALGFRVDTVVPADDPQRITVSRGDVSVELVRVAAEPAPPAPRLDVPPLAASLVVTRAAGGWHTGRAGMQYRDLVPDRLGGWLVASHIRIPEGGPVPDYVHFHAIRFQIIYCRAGWVRLVYEDQGDPFVMRAGEVVVQPPTIRHRVLECAPGLEVIELSCPAVHATYADHALALPIAGGGPPFSPPAPRRERAWGEQRFHCGALAGLAAATGGLVRAGRGDGVAFGFVLEGSARLATGGQTFELARDDAFAIPPGQAYEASGELLALTVC
jgi:quercetin dioxygenase-like cupin family protein